MAKDLMKKLPENWLMWAIGILFVMSIMPGQGIKAADQQAIIETDYLCSVSTDCPVCVGGFADATGILESNLTFFEELAYAKCDNNGKCRISEYCLVWGCPTGSYRTNESGGANIPCKSVKTTVLDNTLMKVNENPKLFLGIVVLFIVWLML